MKENVVTGLVGSRQNEISKHHTYFRYAAVVQPAGLS